MTRDWQVPNFTSFAWCALMPNAHLPPAGLEGPKARTTPRVYQTYARPLPGPRSAPQPSPRMAAEATDEDDEEARAFYHHTRLPGYGG